MLSELVGGRWWEAALHTRRTQRLRMQVYGTVAPTCLVMPWQLELPETEQVLAEEEPEAAAAQL